MNRLTSRLALAYLTVAIPVAVVGDAIISDLVRLVRRRKPCRPAADRQDGDGRDG